MCEPRVVNSGCRSHRVRPIFLTHSYLDSFLVIREEKTGLKLFLGEPESPDWKEGGEPGKTELYSVIRRTGPPEPRYHETQALSALPLVILQLNTHTHTGMSTNSSKFSPGSGTKPPKSREKRTLSWNSKGFFPLRLILKDTS